MNVTCVNTADAFLSKVNAGERFDAIIMDFQLHSGFNGFELLKFYRDKTGESFFGVMMTAEQDTELRDKVIESGFKFLAKPAEPAKLRSLFQSYLTQ